MVLREAGSRALIKGAAVPCIEQGGPVRKRPFAVLAPRVALRRRPPGWRRSPWRTGQSPLVRPGADLAHQPPALRLAPVAVFKGVSGSCCAGRITRGPCGLFLPNLHGEWSRRIPTQILEAGLAAALWCACEAVWTRAPRGGSLFLSVLFIYAAARWCLEPGREVRDTIGRLSVHRALSAALMALSAMTLVLMELSRLRLH